MPYRKKRIKVALPLEAINEANVTLPARVAQMLNL